MSHVQDLKHKLKEITEDATDRIEEAKFTQSSDLAKTEEELQNAKKLIHTLYNHLKSSNSDSSEAVSLCLSLLRQEESATVKKWDEAAAKHKALKRERSRLVGELKGREMLLKKCHDDIGQREKKIDELQILNDDLQERLEEVREINGELVRGSEDAKERFREERMEQEVLFERLKETLKAKIDEKRKQIKELRGTIDSITQSHEEERKKVAERMEGQIHILKNDLRLEEQRRDEVRSHFESILSDLRGKASDARKSETEARAALQKSETSAKQLKSELMTARIDLRMLEMKFNSAEEKAKREQNLMEIQFTTKHLALESAHQSALEDQKREFESKFIGFLASLCDRFKEFVDFSRAVTEESASAILDELDRSFHEFSKRIEGLEASESELNTVRKILGAKTPIIPLVTILSEESKQIEKIRSQVEKDRNEVAVLLKETKSHFTNNQKALDWEQWAKRICGLVTDDFVTARNAVEWQYRLEEALMGSLSDRQLRRKLEILRAEKELFVSGCLSGVRRGKRRVTLGSLMMVVTCVYKLQRISGHLRCGARGEKVEVSEKRMRRFPIVSFT
jgi:chromosome segregation ATPase